jgi:hypothetical protein
MIVVLVLQTVSPQYVSEPHDYGTSPRVVSLTCLDCVGN